MPGSEPSESCLLQAAKDGNLEEVRRCLAAGLDVNCRDEEKCTPFYWAARRGNITICRYLESHGADKVAKKENGVTPLITACFNGQTEVVLYLIQMSCPVNQTDNFGNSGLHAACLEGKLDTVKCLVQNEADINLKNNEGWTPLSYACYFGRADVVKYLLHISCPVNETNNFGNSGLHLACQQGKLDTVKCLVQNGADINLKDNDGVTPLGHACFRGQTDVVTYLLQMSCPVNETSNLGNSGLHRACYEGKLDTVKCLVQNGADINLKNKEGNTPLILACLNGQTEVVTYLLQMSCPVNQTSNLGHSGLHAACQEGKLDTVNCLVQNGADINLKNNEGWTGLTFACFTGQTDVVTYLLRMSCSVNQTTNCGNSGLHWACQEGKLGIVKCLVQNGADINLKNNEGNTPLQLAKNMKHTAVVEYLQNEQKNRGRNLVRKLRMKLTRQKKNITAQTDTKVYSLNGPKINTLKKNEQCTELSVQNQQINESRRYSVQTDTLSLSSDSSGSLQSVYSKSTLSVDSSGSRVTHKSLTSVYTKSSDGSGSTVSLIDELSISLSSFDLDNNALDTIIETEQLVGRLQAKNCPENPPQLPTDTTDLGHDQQMAALPPHIAHNRTSISDLDDINEVISKDPNYNEQSSICNLPTSASSFTSRTIGSQLEFEVDDETLKMVSSQSNINNGTDSSCLQTINYQDINFTLTQSTPDLTVGNILTTDMEVDGICTKTIACNSNTFQQSDVLLQLPASLGAATGDETCSTDYMKLVSTYSQSSTTATPLDQSQIAGSTTVAIIKDQIIEHQNQLLAHQESEMNYQKSQLGRKDTLIAFKGQAMVQQQNQIQEKDKEITALRAKLSALQSSQSMVPSHSSNNGSLANLPEVLAIKYSCIESTRDDLLNYITPEVLQQCHDNTSEPADLITHLLRQMFTETELTAICFVDGKENTPTLDKKINAIIDYIQARHPLFQRDQLIQTMEKTATKDRLLKYIGLDVLQNCHSKTEEPTKLTLHILRAIFDGIDLSQYCAEGRSRENRPALEQGKLTAILGYIQVRFPTVERRKLINTINQACSDARKAKRKLEGEQSTSGPKKKQRNEQN